MFQDFHSREEVVEVGADNILQGNEGGFPVSINRVLRTDLVYCLFHAD